MRDVLGALVLAYAISLGACGNPTSAIDATSSSSITVRADGLPELSGGNITVDGADSLIFRASIIGSPSDYGTPVITSTVAGLLESRADGSARVLRPAQIDFSAMARAISSATRPQVLTATGRVIVTCTAVLTPGISIQILDSLTNAAPSGSGTMRLRLTDSVHTDSLTTATLISGWSGAAELAGTYSLTIDADGFLPWRQDGIVVQKLLCHVRQVRVVARLVRR
jgi:hypothetical protein